LLTQLLSITILLRSTLLSTRPIPSAPCKALKSSAKMEDRLQVPAMTILIMLDNICQAPILELKKVYLFNNVKKFVMEIPNA
jgi:hypothetical protein